LYESIEAAMGLDVINRKPQDWNASLGAGAGKAIRVRLPIESII